MEVKKLSIETADALTAITQGMQEHYNDTGTLSEVNYFLKEEHPNIQVNTNSNMCNYSSSKFVESIFTKEQFNTIKSQISESLSKVAINSEISPEEKEKFLSYKPTDEDVWEMLDYATKEEK